MDTAGLRADAERLAGTVIAIRRDIHAHPEIGFALPRTQQAVLSGLDGLGMEITTGDGLSSVVAVLRGRDPGPTLLLRADMDALPVTEETGLEFASVTPGVMHACGHDGHTSMLAGAAALLAARRDQISGQVIFMFQPGEETARGATLMLAEGVLAAAGTPAEAAFALHLTANLPSGTFRLRPGPTASACDQFDITITGKGGHGGRPQATLDPIPAAAEIIQALYTSMNRRVSPFDTAVLSICSIQAGTSQTVIPDRAVLGGTIRTHDKDVRAALIAAVARIAGGVAAVHEVTASVEWITGTPRLVNARAMVEQAKEVVTGLYGPGGLTEQPYISMGGEDFAYIAEKIPAAMANLGACPPGADPADAPGNHSARMIIDENALVRGAAVYAGVALAYLAR
jgi:hippurate hydrolase